MNAPLSTQLRKVYQSFRLWGFGRTYVKVFGRTRLRFMPSLPLRLPGKKSIGVLGCGQFAISTIGFFIRKDQGNAIAACFDVDPRQAETFANYYNCRPCSSANEVLDMKGIEVIYIATNHASHTPYAIMALSRGLIVHVEKPISTSFAQLDQLLGMIKQHPDAKIFAGYNRPYAPAIRTLVKELSECKGPLTLNCFVIGHKIALDHWYRKADEGTRISGNVGHWIDLAVHLLWCKLAKPGSLNIRISYSNVAEPDDNISICLTSDLGDLVVITITSREEPFEGINETINLQCENIICKIDDFRRLSIWKGTRHITKRYFRKNVGHQSSVLQPFRRTTRDWTEVEISTRLMLTVMEMVSAQTVEKGFSIGNPRE